MKIDFISVSFKNFLSFGNKTQTVEFKPGLNLITGIDNTTGRSNGAGKSSFFEAITFGLFGRTNRSVTKDKIINWKNRKECEVEVNFKIGRDMFRVKRGIKPDFLEIFKNTKLVIQPPDVRQYQKILENEILKIDYHLFCTLVYVNLNNYTPFLQMDSTRKRIFVEKMFGLEMFSELNKLSNEKLTQIENKLNIHKTEKKIKDNLKSDLQTRTTALLLQLSGIKSSQEELNGVTIKLSGFKNPEGKYNSAVEKYNEIQSMCNGLDSKVFELQSTINFFKKEIITVNDSINKKKNDIEKHKKDKKIFEKIIGGGKKIDSEIEKEIKWQNELKEKIPKTIEKNHKNDITLAKQYGLSDQLTKSLSELDGKVKCPVCNSKIDKKMLPDINEHLSEITKKIDELKSKRVEYSDILLELNQNLDASKSELNTLNTLKKEHDNAKIKLEGIDSIIKAIDIESDNQKIIDLNDKVTACANELVGVEKSRTKAIKQKDKLLQDVTDTKQELDKYKGLLNEKAILEERVVWENDTKKDLNKQITENNAQLDVLEKDCIELDAVCKRLSSLADYLNYIKTICRDENAKQYAISFIMPYLTKQVNHYLAKSEINYYLSLSNIMDEEIKGPGVYNAGYGNLSGGESKSIDLSILFALLDISRLQLGVFPSILLLDELLDTSVDKVGIDNILKIIWQRQADDNSTIFLVTHRSDVAELQGMRVYSVEKTNGFSTISETEN